MNRFSFRTDSPFMRALAQIGDMALINILFIFCSLPLVTVGASAAALYTVTLQMVRHECAHAGAGFLRAFRNNFWQSLILTLLALAAGAGLYVDLRVMQANPGAFPLLLWVGLWLAAAVYFLIVSYVFALQARFQNSVWKTIKNALLLSVTHPLRSVAIAACTLFPIGLFLFATYYFLLSSVFWFLFGFSSLAFINSLLFQQIFRQFDGTAVESAKSSANTPS